MKIYSHINPDADAFCSSAMIRVLGYRGYVIEQDAIVAVDTNVRSRCVLFKERGLQGSSYEELTDMPLSGHLDLVVDHHEVEGADLYGNTTYRDPAVRSCTKVIWDTFVVPNLENLWVKENISSLAYLGSLGYLGDNAATPLNEVVALFSTSQTQLAARAANGVERAFKRHTDAMNARAAASAEAIQHALQCGELVNLGASQVWLYICQPGELVAAPSKTLSKCLAPGRLYPAAIAAPVFARKLVNADTVIVSDPKGVSTFKGKNASEFAALFGGGGHATSAGGKGFTREAFDEAIVNL